MVRISPRGAAPLKRDCERSSRQVPTHSLEAATGRAAPGAAMNASAQMVAKAGLERGFIDPSTAEAHDNRSRSGIGKAAFEPSPAKAYGGAAMTEPQPRKLAGIALIGAFIVLWALFVASLAQFVGKWPVLVLAPYYLFMGVAWVIPLKPLVRWAQTGSFRPHS